MCEIEDPRWLQLADFIWLHLTTDGGDREVWTRRFGPPSLQSVAVASTAESVRSETGWLAGPSLRRTPLPHACAGDGASLACHVGDRCGVIAVTPFRRGCA
jgi:hypothetical protein